ncbi:helix-turn-helix protein [Shimia isoporae]|uniref:Helix-turn-helix protein n=1 Tax=Shimia isoporae TaxID=647720 RepID=A0A4R1NMD2_9RHOB|nr:AraC family transcriptional regulator [Shimia isoporae]TCL09567.1 helix-turn-helix protein [Shimia isoporae]
MPLPPLISAKALGAMPEFTLEHVGEKALNRALKTAGLPYGLLEAREGFIPKYALAEFIDQVSVELGERHIGLMWAPALTIADYGAWGGYVLNAPTLGAALERARQVMPYHSSVDRTHFRAQGDLIGYEYSFGLKGHRAYSNVAFSALGSVLSIFKTFLGSNWKPERIECDLPRTNQHEQVEAVFGCPIVWNARRLEIWFRKSVLTTTLKPLHVVPVTLQDIQRERCLAGGETFSNVVNSVLMQQVSGEGIDLDNAARMLGIGPRSLQRKLHTEGTSFRTLSNQVKANRATELLQEGSLSVKQVAAELGYETPQNFSRAFRKVTGMPPSSLAE